MSITAVPAYIARTQFGSLLKKTAEERERFIITKTGVPTAVLISISDFDDMVEELDKEFQKSLRIAREEYTSGQVNSLADYLKKATRKK